MWIHLWKGHRKERATPTKAITEKGPRSLLLSLISSVFWHCKGSAIEQIGNMLVREKWILFLQKAENKPAVERGE